MRIPIVRWALASFMALLLAAAALPAFAYALRFDPLFQTVGRGAEATVVVHIDGVLPAGLGNYDFDVTFDPTILAFDRAIDGLGLGFAIGLGTVPGAGTVKVSDFSLETVADLLALQGDGFALFSLVFDTLDVGITPLGFDNVTLGDATGGAVGPSALRSASIEVAAAMIPEPATVTLVLAAVMCAVASTRKRRRAGAS